MIDPLQQRLQTALTRTEPGAISVAFSGGPDSTALLHALAQLPQARALGLRALHVDHRLNPQSHLWAAHCQQLCAVLEVPCEVFPVHVELDQGEGLEAAARRARYDALGSALRPGEWLLLGHHRDDQAETVLLKLLRGAGPDGLSGMRERRAFAGGQLWRPLLDVPRSQLAAYIDRHRLLCIDDPSNTDTRLARNLLRQQILPRLLAYWPQAVDSILHSAALSRTAADFLRTQWLGALDTLHDPTTGSLHAADWLALDAALREPLLDYWLHQRGLRAPTTAQRRQIERQCTAQAGRVPCIRWPGTELHIWKERLWALPSRSPVDPAWNTMWHGERLDLPGGGTLELSLPEARLKRALHVRLRQGGERIKPHGDPHTRELRDLFQQAQIPPWQRETCPLLYRDDQLIAAGDRWLNSTAHNVFEHAGARPHWTPCTTRSRHTPPTN